MGHHYVPSQYLKGFTRDSRIWVFEKSSGRSFKSQPDSIANERELYTEALESNLNNAIEQPANEVLLKIARRERLDERDRHALALYVVTMWKRVPAARSRVMDSVPEVIVEVTDELRRDIHLLKGRSAISDARYSSLLAEAARVEAKLKASPPPEAWWGTINPEQSQRVADELLKMNWAFLTDPSGQVLTCDNPVYFFPWAGIGRQESELVFPIDQFTFLLATRERFQTCSYFTGKAAALRELNRRIVGNAERHLFAADVFDWLPRLISNGGGPRTRLRVLG